MTVKAKARTVADFKAAHDRDTIVVNKIRAGLQKLLDIGPEHYEYSESFRAICGLQARDLADYKDRFADHWFKAAGHGSGKDGKVVWFGSAKVAARLRPSPPEKG